MAVIEDALTRLPEDVGAIFESEVIATLCALRSRDIAAYQRIRQRAKKLNPACSITALDAATRAESADGGDEPSVLDELVALCRACHWQRLIDEGVVDSGSEIARREGLHPTTVNELLRLTRLAPPVVQAILAGQQPRTLSLIWLKNHDLPWAWGDQEALFGGFDAASVGRVPNESTRVSACRGEQ